jgi:hypothetical protein
MLSAQDGSLVDVRERTASLDSFLATWASDLDRLTHLRPWLPARLLAISAYAITLSQRA